MFDEEYHLRQQQSQRANALIQRERGHQAEIAILSLKTAKQAEEEHHRDEEQGKKDYQTVAESDGTAHHTESAIAFAEHMSNGKLGSLPRALYGSDFVGLIEPKDEKKRFVR